MRVKILTKEIDVKDEIILDFAEIVRGKNKRVVSKIVKYLIPSYEIFLYHFAKAEQNNDDKKKEYLLKNKYNIVKWGLLQEYRRNNLFDKK